LERIQEEGHNSKTRRDRIFAAGYAKGFAEGKESGFALGLAEGIDKGRGSAANANATVIASLKATNEAVHKQLCNILEQSNGVVTGQLIATQSLRQAWPARFDTANFAAQMTDSESRTMSRPGTVRVSDSDGATGSHTGTSLVGSGTQCRSGSLPGQAGCSPPPVPGRRQRAIPCRLWFGGPPISPEPVPVGSAECRQRSDMTV
jgi:hypothetical protein